MDEWNDLLEESAERPPIYEQANDTYTETAALSETENASAVKEASAPKEKPFRSIFTFQLILCLIIAICMILLNTFCPEIYTNLDSALKEEFARPIFAEEEIRSVWNEVSDFLEGLHPLKPENGDLTNHTILLYKSILR